MSQYEEHRKKNIAQNIERMKALGLLHESSPFNYPTQITESKSNSNQKPKNKAEQGEKESPNEETELESSRDEEHEKHEELTNNKTSGSLKRKRGRGHTINKALEKEKARRAAKGKNLDIQFPPPYFRVCGKHAKFFKSEATICVRQKAPLQVENWRKISVQEVEVMWKHMKENLNLSEVVKVYAMKQLQRQFTNRLHNLHNAYLVKGVMPNDVSLEDWNWLIQNKWTVPKFQERSLKNKENRSKQELKSIIGTKSIVQTAYEMKETSKNDEWPDAMTLWKATHMRSNGTWCIPNGEEIMEDLKNVGEAYGEDISNAEVPLAEHFKYVLGTGKKKNHLRGIGIAPITKKMNTHFIQAQLENAKKRANDLEVQVQNLNDIIEKQQETNIQLRKELEVQLELIRTQQSAFETQQQQKGELFQKELKQELVATLLREISKNGLPNNSSAPISEDLNL